MKRKLLGGKKLEYAAMALFVLAYTIIAVFHEPWFDEAQAWQIAKCASLKEILFEIPHYEGHPPLWWLILAIPAKLGLPFEIGLKSVGFIFTILSVFLIVFKMPYPRLMRLVLPFSYFVFYQFGIIVRPYVLMMLAFLLLALAFPSRFLHPWRYACLLALLCMTSAYGLVLAGGIAICMVMELVQEMGVKRFFSCLFTDQRTLALGALLVSAILIILQIMPRRDTWITSAVRTNSFLTCLCCALLTFLGECTLTTSSWFRIDRVLLQNAVINTTEFVAFCVIGIFLWCMIICSSSKKALKYCLIPYVLLSVFASLVYFSVHHVSIIFAFFLFWLGILFQDKDRYEIGRLAVSKIAQTPKDRSLMKKTALAVCCVCMAVPVFWCITACSNEVKMDFSYGREKARFLKDHHMDNAFILSAWIDAAEFTDTDSDSYINTYAVGNPVLLNAYFDHNICRNLNGGRDNEAYMHYKIAMHEEMEAALADWKSAGIPDVLLGRPDLQLLYGDKISYADYTLADIFYIRYIWKYTVSGGFLPLYVRTELLDHYALEPYADEKMKYLLEGVPITEETLEKLRNGELTVEEYLKPYLDAMFGEEQ